MNHTGCNARQNINITNITKLPDSVMSFDVLCMIHTKVIHANANIPHQLSTVNLLHLHSFQLHLRCFVSFESQVLLSHTLNTAHRTRMESGINSIN